MNIAVFCGSGMGNNPAFQKAAEALGEWIGKQGHILVYGGGDTGLMGITAKAARENGAKVTGVVPSDVEFIRNRPQPYCDEVIFTKNMSERKEKMQQISDAFVALPGGIGTLDEISEVITLTKIGVINKKSIMLNTEGFYEPFRALIKKMSDSAFLTEDEMKHVLFSDNMDEIQTFLER